MATTQISSVIQHLRQIMLAQDGAGRTDGQLLASFIDQKDEAAFEALVRRHGPMVFSVCRRVTGNHHDAEDAFQATFLVLARKASSVRPRERVANWLHGVALRTAMKVKATTTKRQGREKQVTEMPEPEAVQQDQWLDLQPLLDQELNGLPENYRLPILLCDLEGKTIKEAAQQLGWPQGTLAGRLARGRKLLAKRLVNRGVSLSAGSLAVILSQNVASAAVPTSLMSSTVKAATMIAAGQAAVAGVVPTKVAALTEGVMKAMLLSKLKTASLALTIAVLAGMGVAIYSSEAAQPRERAPEPKNAEPRSAPNVSPENAAKKDQQELVGVWEVVSVVSAGKQVEKIFYDGSVWVFDGKKIRGQGPNTYTLSPSQKPKTIDVTSKRRISNTKYGPEVTDLGIYEIRGDELRVAMREPKYGRPKDLDSTEENHTILTVMKRVRLGE